MRANAATLAIPHPVRSSCTTGFMPLSVLLPSAGDTGLLRPLIQDRGAGHGQSFEYERRALTRSFVHISHITAPCQEAGDAGSRFRLCVRLCYLRGRHGHAASHLTARSHADNNITHRVAPSCACPGRPKIRRLVEKAVTAAARLGATWIITPELIVTGYTFADSIGTKWTLPQPDSWMTRMSQLAAQTAGDPVPILPRTGPKIPQALQQLVRDRSEWNPRRRTSKN